MKKTSILVVAAAVGILAAGCGNKEAKQVDANALAKSLTTEITYDDTLSQLTDDDISNYIDVPEGVDSVMYMGSGKTAEEVAVFTAQDEATAQTVKENVEMFLEDQSDSFEKYIPEESKRIEDAVLVQNGNYVVLCVSGDSGTAQKLIDEALK